MVNINTLNAALWRVQFAKNEHEIKTRAQGLEGSWSATQHMAELLTQEATLINAINLLKNGKSASLETKATTANIFATLPAVH